MILPRATLRHLLRHPLQGVFAILGVALGVAVVIGIDLANQSASRAFELSASVLAGEATHQIVGGAQPLPEKTYTRLRLEAGVNLSAPVVEGYATDPQSGLTLQVLGIDPLAEGPFRAYTPDLDGGDDFSRLISKPAAALLDRTTADRLGLQRGDTLELEVAGERRALTLIGFLNPSEQVAAQALQNVAVVDIATAQELLDRLGELSRIDLILPEGAAGEAVRSRIAQVLPADATVIPASTRGDVMAQMTDAFRLNLTALSLLGLVVGMFLIYNTITFAVVRRRRLLGILRTLGVSRRQIFLLTLGEALLIGAIGTGLGLLLGVGLAHGLLNLVTRTIEDLYFVLNVQQLALSPLSLTKGLLLGILATLAAALVPAREATNTPPRTVLSRSALESSHRRLIPRAALAGAVMMTLGGILLLPGRSLLLSFVALFALIAGYALLVPALMALLLRGALPLSGRVGGFLGRLATRNLGASLSRTGVATAALAVAVSATIGVGVMVSSFRLTVDEWLHSYLRADIYLTTPSTGFEASRPPLEPDLVDRLSAGEGVELATRARHLLLERPEGLTELFVVEVPPRSFAGYEFTGGDRERIWQSFTGEAAVLVSEPYAYHHDLQRGDTIALRTDRGPVDFRVAGIFYDYGSGRGRITMERAVFARYWDEPQVDALGFYLAPGYEAEQVAAALRRQATGEQQVLVYSNRALREASLATFDRTFRITQVLRLLAVAVAFVGILSALMALQLERGRDLAVLRATGLTPRQVWGLVNGETTLMGLLAGLLSLPLGVIQALVLIYVINRRSFGWTMQTWLSPEVFVEALLLALGAALLAGIYPAWRMARTRPALALREE